MRQRASFANGGGTFQPARTFAAGGTVPDSVAAGDFNGHGKLDLVVANADPNNVVGSTPTTASAQYTGPISVPRTTTIEAITVAPRPVSSSVASATHDLPLYSPITERRTPDGKDES
jgi:hypothetical protein